VCARKPVRRRARDAHTKDYGFSPALFSSTSSSPLWLSLVFAADADPGIPFAAVNVARGGVIAAVVGFPLGVIEMLPCSI